MLSRQLGRSVWMTCAQCRLYRSSNAGVRKRLKIYKQENPDLSRVGQLSEKDFEDMEMDIMKPSAVRKDYEREYAKIKKTVELRKIERQFFEKRKLPNFLFWSEKEQIRQLHQEEPTKWTLQKLSESFPATPDIISKIVKAQWKLEAGAVRKHDEKVLENWKAFRNGQLELPSYLKEHLSSFTTRDRSSLPEESSDLVTLDESSSGAEKNLLTTKHTEFVDIIRNYKGKPSPVPIEDPVSVSSQPSETFVLGGKLRKKTHHFTLSEMKKSGRIENSEGPPVDANGSGSSSDRSSRVTGSINPSQYFSVPKHPSSSDTAIEDDPLDEIPMKIVIPKEKWKKGAVYKVNGCFYADDGEFLYKI